MGPCTGVNALSWWLAVAGRVGVVMYLPSYTRAVLQAAFVSKERARASGPCPCKRVQARTLMARGSWKGRDSSRLQASG